MRSLFAAFLLLLAASGAQAQIKPGSFKLSIDTDVLSYSTLVTEFDEVDETDKTKIFSIGPGATAVGSGLPGYVGLVFGYVAHPHVIPQLHLSVGHASGSEENDDLPSVTTLMLRPEVEIPFNPDAQVVGYGLLGFDYRREHRSLEDEDGDYEFTLNGYGPVVGAGLHIFASSLVSFDLGAQFSYLVTQVDTSTPNGEFDQDDDEDTSVRVFSLTAGLSLWP